MQKIMKCGLIGGLILFLWGAAFWTLMPWKKAQMKSFTNEREVRTAIANNIDGSGLYVLPNLNDYLNSPSKMEAAKERMREGPYVVAAIRACGKNPNMTADAIASLILKALLAGIATSLLLKTHHTNNFTNSVKFITMIGLLVALASTIPYFIWFAFPLTFTVCSFIEILFGWFFAGLAIARLVAEPKRRHH